MSQKEKDIQLLMDCIKNKDAELFVNQYKNFVKKIIYSMANKRNIYLQNQDIEDLIQIAFEHIFKKDWYRLKQYDETRGMSVKSWIALLTQHAAWDHIEKFKNTNSINTDYIESIDINNPNPYELFAEKEHSIKLINNFTSKKQLIFKLYYIENRPVKEIAFILHRKEGAIYKTIRQIRSTIEKMDED